MNKNDYMIRLETKEEQRDVEYLVRESFWNVYRPGYGKKLLDYGFEKAAELGYGAVCFEGNIDFYGKSGCIYASEKEIRYHGMPEGEEASFFLCKELQEGYLNGITGEYTTPQVYYVDDTDVDEFDQLFPPKQKLKLPGQLFD